MVIFAHAPLLATYIITPTAGAGGSISPSTPQTMNHGDSQTFTITADTNYHIADVLVDGGSVGAVAVYAFSNVTADHTISATFAIDTYTPPTISSISNQSTEVSTPISVTFTISDAETALTSLMLSADSSNTALVTTTNILFAGSGAERVATITPTTGVTGTATITITVSDGALSAYETFVLTAGPVADSYIFLPLVLRNS